MTERPDPNPYWSRTVRDRWFFAFLTVSTLGLVWVVWPYVYDILFAAVTVAVTWPIFERLNRLFRGRRLVASVATTLLLGIVVFGPLAYLLYLFYWEARTVTDLVVEFLQTTDSTWLEDQLESSLVWIGEYSEEARDWLEAQLGRGDDPEIDGIASQWQGYVLSGLQDIAAGLPGVVRDVAGGIFTYSIHLLIFLFTLLTLYVEGPRILKVIKNLSPMDDRYEEQLFATFAEISSNMVVGSVATAAIQGVVAAFGFWVVGIDRVLFLGICTAVFSFMPIVGTLIIWLPISIYLGVTGSWQAATFLALYSLFVTGTVDNVLRPFFVRGATDIHPMLVFLAVFGGMYWLGVPGVLIGPLLVAFFLALYGIYVEDYLGEIPEEAVAGPGPLERARALLDRVARWLSSRRGA